MGKTHVLSIRLNDEELAFLDDLMVKQGLRDRGGAVRYMLHHMSERSEEEDIQRFFKDTKSLMNISAKNSEIALELLNSICISSGTEPYDSKIKKSTALTEAMMNVNARIAERTKYKNNARHGNPASGE